MIKWRGAAVLVFVMGFSSVRSDQEESSSRDEKVFNVLNVVQFPNDACTTSTGLTGVCYSSSECTELGGSELGQCANGFGSCCYFTATCDSTININNTYFEKLESWSSSPCQAKVCKIEEDICQIRLDFVQFDLDQPETSSPTDTDGSAVTQCQKSSFKITSDTQQSPLICGSNTGYHMLVEAQDECNEITIAWTDSSTTRAIQMKVSQIACSATWKAPDGCTQWFTGTSGTVYSYNYQGGVHLANQNYNNCIRREQGYCGIAYSNGPSAFQLSGTTVDDVLIGGYCVTDFVVIPYGAPTLGSNTNTDRFCGGNIGYATSPGTTTGNTIYVRRYPFQIGVAFNNDEASTPAELSKGFAIDYQQLLQCG